MQLFELRMKLRAGFLLLHELKGSGAFEVTALAPLGWLSPSLESGS